MTGTNQC